MCWLDWLSVSGWRSDGVTLGGEAGVTLDEDNDTFDETPDAAAHDGDVGEENKETEEEAHEWYLGGEGKHDGGNHDKNETAAGEGDMKNAFFVFAEVPVLGAESTEENAEETGSDGGFHAGGDGVLEAVTYAGSIRVGWIGVWVHKISLKLVKIAVFIIAGFGGKSKGWGCLLIVWRNVV